MNAPLSMSMFANRADFLKALDAQTYTVGDRVEYDNGITGWSTGTISALPKGPESFFAGYYTIQMDVLDNVEGLFHPRDIRPI